MIYEIPFFRYRKSIKGISQEKKGNDLVKKPSINDVGPPSPCYNCYIWIICYTLHITLISIQKLNDDNGSARLWWLRDLARVMELWKNAHLKKIPGKQALKYCDSLFLQETLYLHTHTQIFWLSVNPSSWYPLWLFLKFPSKNYLESNRQSIYLQRCR